LWLAEPLKRKILQGHPCYEPLLPQSFGKRGSQGKEGKRGDEEAKMKRKRKMFCNSESSQSSQIVTGALAFHGAN
jgi:hypothetical protein